ncbi:trifunctional serine/threonine-protein kinase/ATP-binding protein/sensor histidine kinase [Anabaena sp. FACHB-709]|uniref:histidine kinase n=2 Tax=Nostocaceae TaxID=1162 RepID=A0A1Z4KS90_ANAVA|nr:MULTISPECIES: ATP-binding sensor histidine kinase [Nostocaceae]BAY71870.1 serine/threonine protein kinase with two-component sensor domain [Trichormus variabilis NIES-23]HBW33779.1 serine/threonine protein kinase [Nostoc sp. UBA8866]MBD2172223.1 AAA family ATPase [Anabaena cylindrica FACHB-318]MBD2263956.1 AAA family ATPase [Anabaena sp. FACHB-709]MBD2273164.1 AAA family ATPase [Nostoc sp. PCC 7120 = FACHB-418]
MSATVDTTVLLSGYQLIEQLYHGSKTLVYRGIRRTDSAAQPVVIKLLQREYPSFSELLQFRNQYTIAKNLNIPGIVHPTSLEPYGNSYALVMEDFGGVSLGSYSQTHPLSLGDVLAIAIQLANILHDLYQNRVIHKDIKPANLLIHPETKEIKLIDFSIASLLPKETEAVKHPKVLEGTLAYLAPEQTGRMNRGIDYRSDFYAFGVTLFELLTGKLPFISDDPLELVHCHIAKPAPSVCALRPEIPAVIGEIIGKLMAKNAEDRYQSALGLQYDLQNCLDQLQNTGKIETFEIATRDICDRFLIPEKLYGREEEVATLLKAFARVSHGKSELMLVAGFSGIGKTAVVHEVHKPIVEKRGYFIKGKFDQFNRSTPFSAFVQAFRDLMGQLLSESDEQLQTWKTQLLQAVGENGQVIIDVIPELERIIGEQPLAIELSGNAAQNRFKLLLQNFIHVFTTPEHPLVIFLDDLQWADSASLNLMQGLIGESKTGYLLVLGAYRDHEVYPAHPLMLTLEAIQKTGATTNTITLQPLSLTSLNQLIADTLNCTATLAQPLTKLVNQKTKGNPFFATQFLKALYQDGLICFDLAAGYWQCDIVQVKAAALTDDVVEFMALQLQKLPPVTQNILKLAACIGNEFDLNTLAIVSELSPASTATILWKALQEELILPLSETYKFFQSSSHQTTGDRQIKLSYKFFHDRVQQAAYSLIPQEQKTATHLKIGQLLLKHTPETQLENRIFDIVNQLNVGVDYVTDKHQKQRLLELNLMAGRKAKVATAYVVAVDYLNTAIKLLEEDSWQNQYELTLSLYDLVAEAEYLNTNFPTSELLVKEILVHAKHTLDKIKAYEIQIQAYTAQNKLIEAINIGREVLGLLGIDLPQDGDMETILAEHSQLKSLLGKRSIQDLVNLPELTDLQQGAALRILCSLFAPIYLAKPMLLPLKIFTMVKICTQYGNSPQSAIAYSLYGLFLCASEDITDGYQFGQLAMTVLDKFNAQELKSKVYLTFALFIKHWQDSISSTLNIFLEGLKCGLETGDLEYVGYCANCYAQFLFWTGENLEFAEAEANKYCSLMQDIKQDISLIWGNTWRQTVMNLQAKVDNPQMLVGKCFDETVTLPALIASRNTNGICYVYLAKLFLAYLLGADEQAIKYASLFEEYEQGAAGLLIVPLKNFYQSLSLLSLYPQLDTEQQSRYLEKITNNQQKMQKWAGHAPINYQHKFYLVAAEKHRVLDEKTAAIELYDQAIALAKTNGYIQEAALANELAAKFYLNWGKEKVAAGYMQEAYYCYAHWGSPAKTNDLESRYPQLLRPILQQAIQPLSILETFTSLTNSVHSTRHQSSSSASINYMLDFAALLQVSQAISSTIQLDKLLETITETMLENSGADYCALMLCQEGECQVRVIANSQQTTLQSTPLENNPTVPIKLIQYVKNTSETVVIHDLKTNIPGVMSNYLDQHQPKSVLCLPLINQGNLIGILYLENQVTSDVFTSDRLLVLRFLSSQAVIALENARLYHQVQQTLEDLQQAQVQMVQNEKMSALGNLVAGVAHEINNPVGCIVGNISAAQEYINDLLGVIDLYREQFPQPGRAIENELETIDLEYLREDLPKLIKAMKDGGDRIKAISESLRTFSRADSDQKQPFNLHEGIESTLLILRHRLKANQYRPAIEVVTEYSDLPLVKCFPGQLNQVFMNILANAIDALDESNPGYSFAEIEANPNRITIRTTIAGEQIKIAISDNGHGIPEEVKAKIFDHLFTTKGVGKGTGLGLAIAHQIIVEKHGGAIAVNSKPGIGTEFLLTLPIS